MARKIHRTKCSSCDQAEKRLDSLEKRLNKVEKRNEKLRKQNQALEKRNQELEEQLAKSQKTSANSSKPPSSDIVNPDPKGKDQSNSKKGQKKRNRGGQPGHQRHQRTPFEEDQIDWFHLYYHDDCPCCGGKLQDDLELKIKSLQHIELDKLQFTTEEHYSVGQRCLGCDKVHYASWPEDLKKAGLVGPRLTSLVGYLKGPCNMSYGNIRKFMRDVVGVRISRGQLRKLVGKVGDSLHGSYDALLMLLPQQGQLNVDETSHKENGKRFWTWCFKAAMFTLFKISPSRGSDVLIEVLGKEFDGVIGCDYFSAYRKYMRLNENVLLQFCMAHLIRDVKFLETHPNAKNRAYGKRLLELFRELFGTIHRKDEFPSEAAFQKALRALEVEITWAATEKTDTAEMYNMAERFIQHGESYFRFITTPGIEPTNNTAEQAIRFVAIHRRLTQGTRAESGRNWCERIWTAVETCQQQGRSVFEFLCESVASFFQGEPGPSLIMDSS